MSISPSPSSPKNNPAPSGAQKPLPASKKGAVKPVVQAKQRLSKEAKVVNLKPQSPFVIPNLYWRLGLAIVLGLVMVGGILFVGGKLRIVAEEVRKKRSQLTALSEKEENYRQLKVALASVEKLIPSLEKALPKEQETIDFLTQIQKVEAETGVEVVSFGFTDEQPKPDEAGNNYIELVFEAHGTTEALDNFTKKFLGLPFFIKVKLIDIAGLDGEGSQMVFRAWLYVDSDFFPETK